MPGPSPSREPRAGGDDLTVEDVSRLTSEPNSQLPDYLTRDEKSGCVFDHRDGSIYDSAEQGPRPDLRPPTELIVCLRDYSLVGKVYRELQSPLEERAPLEEEAAKQQAIEDAKEREVNGEPPLKSPVFALPPSPPRPIVACPSGFVPLSDPNFRLEAGWPPSPQFDSRRDDFPLVPSREAIEQWFAFEIAQCNASEMFASHTPRPDELSKIIGERLVYQAWALAEFLGAEHLIGTPEVREYPIHYAKTELRRLKAKLFTETVAGGQNGALTSRLSVQSLPVDPITKEQAGNLVEISTEAMGNAMLSKGAPPAAVAEAGKPKIWSFETLAPWLRSTWFKWAYRMETYEKAMEHFEKPD